MSATKKGAPDFRELNPSPGPNPERAIYGLALFLASFAFGAVYVVWAFVPPKYLIEIGIDFLPSRYWAIVGPLSLCVIIIFIPMFYGIICLRCMPSGGLEHLAVDSFSRSSEYHRVINTPIGGIPPLCDIPLELLDDTEVMGCPPREPYVWDWLGCLSDPFRTFVVLLYSTARCNMFVCTMHLMVKFGFSFGCLGLFALGVWDVLLNFEKNRCEMTYMFEYPDYVPVKVKDHVRTSFPEYGLYVYGEGVRATQYHRKIYKGIPILFVPGNAGSYKQARSLGSVLQRLAEKRQHGIIFDVFTVDLNEEFAALYGGFLQEQTKFVVKCLEHISQLYGHQKRIVLVGHSVGGIIARAVFLNPEFNTSAVDMIVTYSTPHRPVIATDDELQEFYDDVNEYWQRSIDQTLRHVVLISFAGGHRDVLIRSERSDLTALFHGQPRILSMTTTSIPEVWASTDHLCIVWCKQLVIATSKALFEMVDVEARQLATDSSRKVAVLRKYFTNPVSRVRELGVASALKNLPIRPAAGKRLRIRSKNSEAAYYQLFSLEDLRQDIFIHSSWWSNHWISLCFDDECSNTTTVDVTPSRIPWFSEHSHFIATIPRSILRNLSFLALEIPRVDKFLVLDVERTLSLGNVPNISLRNASFVPFKWKEQMLIAGKSYMKFSMHLTEVWEAIQVRVQVLDGCRDQRGILRFWSPGFPQDTYRWIDENTVTFTMKLQKSRISGDFPVFEMILQPTCRYVVELSVPWLEVFGQIVRFYVLRLPAFFAAVVVVKSLAILRNSPDNLWDHLAVNVVVVIGLFISRLLPNYGDVDVGFEGSSWITSLELWLLFYGVAYCIVGVFTAVLHIAIAVYSWPVYYVVDPLVRTLQRMQMKSPTYFHRHLVFPTFAVLASWISYATCGENGILVAILLYFIKTAYLRRNSSSSVDRNSYFDVNEHSQLILLALLAAFVNVVPTIVWTKRLPSNFIDLWKASYANVDPDPSFTLSIILGIALDLFTYKKSVLTKTTSIALDLLNVVMVYLIASMILLYAQHAFYLINSFLMILLTGFAVDSLRKSLF